MCILKAEKPWFIYTTFMWIIESSVQVRESRCVCKRERVTETEKPIVTFLECSERVSDIGTTIIPFH